MYMYIYKFRVRHIHVYIHIYTDREKINLSTYIYICISKIYILIRSTYNDKRASKFVRCLRIARALRFLARGGSKNQKRRQVSFADKRTYIFIVLYLYEIVRKLCTSALLARNISISTIPYLLFYCVAMTWRFTDPATGLRWTSV